MALSSCSEESSLLKQEIRSEVFPKIIAFNPEEGYTTNQYNGKKIEQLKNSKDNDIITGEKKSLIGYKVPPETIQKPKIITIQSDNDIKTAYPNRIPVLKVPQKILLDSIQIVNPKRSANDTKSNHIILKTDTLKTGVPISAVHILNKTINKIPVKAENPIPNSSSTYNISFLGRQQGLPGYEINCMKKDALGRIWIGSLRMGLIMFDGVYFTQYTENEGLPGNIVKEILEDSNGNLWILTTKGICKFNGDQFIEYRNPSTKNSIIIGGAIDPDDNIWIALSSGVTKFDGKHFTNFSTNEGLIDNQASAIFCAKNGDIWISSISGCTIYNGKFYKHLIYGKSLPDHMVLCFEEDNDKNIWMGTLSNGAYKYDGDSIQIFTTKEGLPDDEIRTVFKASNGNIWFGSNESVCEYDGKNFTSMSRKEGVDISDGCFDIIEVENGVYWFASWKDGINIYNSNTIEYFTQKNGCSDKVVKSIIQDDKNNIWVGTDGDGLLCFNGKEYTKYNEDGGLPNNRIYSILQDSKKNLWVSFFGMGVGKLNGSELTYYNESTGLNGTYIVEIFEDSDGNIWFSDAFNGVAKFTGEEFIHYSEKNGLNTGVVYCMEESPDQKIWLGTTNGLIQIEGNSYTHFSEKEGFSSNVIYDMTLDNENRLWLATNRGINIFNGKTIQYITSYQGLKEDLIWSLQIDERGHIWAGSSNGLYEITLIRQKLKINFFENYDGLHQYRFLNKSRLIDRNKNLWFGQNGIVKINSKYIARKYHITKPTISRVDIGGRFLDFRNTSKSETDIQFSSVAPFTNAPKDLTLSSKNNYLTIYYSAIQWAAPHKVLYSYKLIGNNNDWSTPSSDTKADFRDLQYGEYTFRLRAKGDDGIWSEPVDYKFYILPPWYHTWWARTFFVIIGLLFIYILFRLRTQRLRNRQMELEKEVNDATFEINKQKEEAIILKEKAQESEAFKQQFLANMSHEIRTPMNAVMGMTNLALQAQIDEKAKSYLEKVQKSSDNLLHIINDILDLSKIEAGKMEIEQIDMSLADTVGQVKQTLLHKAEEKGLELFTRIDSSVNDIVLGDPVRLNQVLINLAGNAIKFTEKGSVSIELKEVDSKVRFSVIDTGIGIPADKVQSVFESFSQANASDTRKYGGTGLGLSISQQLVELMGGTISIESEEGKGTTFFFDLELEKGVVERLEQRLAAEENVDGSILDGLTILVADDNEYNRIVAKDTLLSKANVTVIEAENGQEAIDKLTDKVDIILMDAQMPVLNGFDATKLIRSKGNNIPIIALTASVLRTDLDRCTDAGMNGYIPKPFKAHDLITGIAKVLNIELKLDKAAKKEVQQETKSSDSVTDLTYLREFCEGDEAKMQKYIDMFLKSAPPFLEKLNELIQAEDAKGIANHVHGFNTKFTMMGMKETKSLSIEIENGLREKMTTNQVSTEVFRLRDQIRKGIEELTQYE